MRFGNRSRRQAAKARKIWAFAALGGDCVKAAQRPQGLALTCLSKDTLSGAGEDDFDGLPRIQTMRRGLCAQWGK